MSFYMQQRMFLIFICLSSIVLNASGAPLKKMPLQERKEILFSEFLEEFKEKGLLPHETGLTSLHAAVMTDMAWLVFKDIAGKSQQISSQVDFVIKSYKATVKSPIYIGIKSKFDLYELLTKKSSLGRTAEDIALAIANLMVKCFLDEMPESMSRELSLKSAREEAEKKGCFNVFNLLKKMREEKECE